MESVFIQSGIKDEKADRNKFGGKVGFLTKIFGCGHQNLSRPFSQNNLSYRTCLSCGARKHFNSDTLETSGDFYYPQTFVSE